MLVSITMKHVSLRILAAAVVLSLVGVSTSIYAQYVPRTVLFEEGTNWACPPCAVANPYIEQFIKEHAGGVLQISYHPNWPGNTDPMYLNDVTNNQQRVVNYYGISGVPDVVFDGMFSFNPGSKGQLEGYWNSRIAAPSPILLAVTRSVKDTTVSIQIDVTAVGDVSSYSPLYLRVAAVESEVDVKGPNGEPKYVNAERTMLPNFQGTKLKLVTGVTQTFKFTYPIKPAYVASRLSEIAFVQCDNSTHEVLQAASSQPTSQLLAPKPGTQLLTRSVGTGDMQFSLQNFGSTDGHYTLKYRPTSLNPWAAKLQGQDASSPVSFNVKAGEAADIALTFTEGDAGYTSGVLTAQKDDGTTSILPVKVIGQGVRTAFLDLFGDSATSMQTELSLISAKERYALLSSAEAQAFKGWSPKNFQELVVAAGKGIVDGIDKQGVKDFMNAGGHLLLNGGEIAFGLSDALAASTNDAAFLSTYLHATYVKDSAGPRVVYGVANDSVSGSLLGPISIYANKIEVNQPDQITVAAEATPIFYYGQGTSQPAGLRFMDHTNGQKLVYLAFGLENLSTADEASIVASSLKWFRTSETAAVDAVDQPTRFGLSQNFPNPFNPSTEITYTLDHAGPASLTLYDTKGDIVRTLANGSQQTGSHSIKVDASQLPSGVYFYVLRSGLQVSRKAMTLVK